MYNSTEFFINLKSNYWLIPALLITSITIMTLVLINIDIKYDHDVNYVKLLGWYNIGPYGAREIFSVIATSTITVASIVFSITILALSQASNQISPRILPHFMGNSFTQITLGLIAGIFVYCLLVLEIIHTGHFVPEFAPKLAIIFGIILSIFGVVFLVAFIYHIAYQLQAAVIIAKITEHALQSIQRIFPKQLMDTAIEKNEIVLDQDLKTMPWLAIPATKTGYIVCIDQEKLLNFASANDVVIKFEHEIGGLVIVKSTLLKLSKIQSINDEIIRKLNNCFMIKPYRNIHEDVAFGIQQLSDITIKVLSEGIRDVTTAVIAIDHLAIVLSDLINRELPDYSYLYENNKLRLIKKPVNFAKFCAIALNQIRQNASGNVTIITRLFHTIEMTANLTRNHARKAILLHHLNSILLLAKETVMDANDLQTIEAKADQLREIL